MSLILPGAARNLSTFTIRYGHARRNDNGSDEPVLIIERRGSDRIGGPVGMDEAHLFLDDTKALERGKEIMDHLYGNGGYTRKELYAMIDKLTESLIDLLQMPPPPPKTKRDLDNELDRAGAVITVNGEVLVDAR